MLKIGEFNNLVVERAVDFGLYLNEKEEEVLLPSKYVPENTRPGDMVSVFVYTDSEDRLVATTLKPKALLGEFAFLSVKDMANFGAFMDWGLEKDLLVPNSEQPIKMKIGEKHVVKVCLDTKTGRLFGTGRVLSNCEKNPDRLRKGQAVNILVYGFSTIGVLAVMDNTYSGMLHGDETYENLSIGDRRTGYINRIHEDGKIDLSLKKPGYTSIRDSSSRIMNALEKSDGFIACHDKSSPVEIKNLFQMSKKEFKRTIGNLYKKGIITITGKGIRLKP
jgi:uncharacterized protein